MTEATRDQQRYPSAFPLSVRSPLWGEFVELRAHNVSRKGFFVQTGTPPPVGSELELRVALPEGGVTSIRARIMHVVSPERAEKEGTTPGMGVHFFGMTAEQERCIDALVEAARATGTAQDGTGSLSALQPVDSSSDTSVSLAIRAERGCPARRPSATLRRKEWSPEEARVLARLQVTLAELKEQDDCAVLGLIGGEGGETARAAFLKLSKQYHPDLFARYEDPAIKRAATDIFIRVQHAYLRLWDRATQPRPEPREPPAPSPVVSDKGPVQSSPESTDESQATAHGVPLDRASLIGQSARADPSPIEGSVSAELHVARALKHAARQRYREAEADLELALANEPHNVHARVWLLIVQARRLKAQGADAEAAAKYQAVLELNEKNREAATEVRAFHNARRRSQGFFARLFKRGN